MQMQIILPQLELHKIENEFTNVPHIHENQFQLTIPIRGTCYFTHENTDLALAAGEALVLHPRDRHYFRQGSDASVIIIKVNDRSVYPPAIAENTEPALRQRIDPMELAGQFRKWATGVFESERVDTMAAEETESQVLHFLHRLLWGDRVPTFRKSVAALSDRHISRALEYIHAHYTGQMNLDTLASIALQSRFHFIRSFKSVTGFTPYQYVLQLRVEEAKERLLHPDATVTDISFSLGFSSTSQFYRAFLKSVGMTPELYRNERR